MAELRAGPQCAPASATVTAGQGAVQEGGLGWMRGCSMRSFCLSLHNSRDVCVYVYYCVCMYCEACSS